MVSESRPDPRHFELLLMETETGRAAVKEPLFSWLGVGLTKLGTPLGGVGWDVGS